MKYLFGLSSDPTIDVYGNMEEVRNELVCNQFFSLSSWAFSFSDEHPPFPIFPKEAVTRSSADAQQLPCQLRELCPGAERAERQGLCFLTACLPVRLYKLQDQSLGKCRLPPSQSVPCKFEREPPYSLEGKGVSNSVGITCPALKQSFVWTSITMNQQQIPQLTASREPAQPIRSPCST